MCFSPHTHTHNRHEISGIRKLELWRGLKNDNDMLFSNSFGREIVPQNTTRHGYNIYASNMISDLEGEGGGAGGEGTGSVKLEMNFG